MTRLKHSSTCDCGRNEKVPSFVRTKANLKFYGTRSGGRFMKNLSGTDANGPLLDGISDGHFRAGKETNIVKRMSTPLKNLPAALKRNPAGFTCRDREKELKLPQNAACAAVDEKIMPACEGGEIRLSPSLEQFFTKRHSVDIEFKEDASNSLCRSTEMMEDIEMVSKLAETFVDNDNTNNFKHGDGKHVEGACNGSSNNCGEEHYNGLYEISEDSTVPSDSQPSNTEFEHIDLNSEGEINFPRKSKKKRSECERLYDSIDDLHLLYPLKRQRKPPSCYYSYNSASGENCNRICEENADIAMKKKPRVAKKKKAGPIEHFLDVYMRNCKPLVEDEQSPLVPPILAAENCVDLLSNSDPRSPALHCSSTTTHPMTMTTGNNASEAINQAGSGDEVSTSCVPANFLLEAEDLSQPGKQFGTASEYTTPTPLTGDCIDYEDPVDSLLGLRHNKGFSELLVLFKDGTSNWITGDTVDYDDNMKSVLQDYYRTTGQALSATNRLFFDLFGKQSFQLPQRQQKSKIPAMPVTPPRRKIPPVWSVVSSDSPCSMTVPEPSYPVKNVLTELDLHALCSNSLSVQLNQLYPYQRYQELVTKHDHNFTYILLQSAQKLKSEHCRKDANGELNVLCCRNVIEILEESSLNQQCKAVIVSGIEDYFVLPFLMTKLLKTTPAAEGRTYEEDVSVIRFLIQTIRNFSKPIIAVVKKPARGLAACILSLFDLVIDESKEKPVLKKNDDRVFSPAPKSISTANGHKVATVAASTKNSSCGMSDTPASRTRSASSSSVGTPAKSLPSVCVNGMVKRKPGRPRKNPPKETSSVTAPEPTTAAKRKPWHRKRRKGLAALKKARLLVNGVNGVRPCSKSIKREDDMPSNPVLNGLPAHVKVEEDLDETNQETDSSKVFHRCAFPRIMGLTNENEATLMGIGNQECFEQVRKLTAPCMPHLKSFSTSLRISLRSMKKLAKIGDMKKTYRHHYKADQSSRGANDLFDSFPTSVSTSRQSSGIDSIASSTLNERHQQRLDSIREQIEEEKKLAMQCMTEIQGLWTNLEDEQLLDSSIS